MKLRNLFTMICMTMIMVLIAACGNNAPVANTPTGGDNTASNATALSQTESSTSAELGGTASVKYPEGWQVKSEAGNIFLSNTAEGIAAVQATDSGTIDLPSGTLALSISLVPLDNAVAGGIGDSPKSFVESFKSVIAAGENMPEFGETQELTIGGNPAAQTSGSNDKADSLIIVVQKEKAFVIMVAVAPKGELAGHQAIIQDIAASAEFVASAE